MGKGSAWQWVVTFVLMMGLVMVLGACGTETGGGSDQESDGPKPINGMTPAQVVAKYKTAYLQDDEQTMYNLWSTQTRENKRHSDLQGPQNQKQLYSGYKLTEYKYDDDTYYYKLTFTTGPDDGAKYKYRVVREKDGWKYDSYVEIQDLEAAIVEKGMKPRVVKGTDDKPLKFK